MNRGARIVSAALLIAACAALCAAQATRATQATQATQATLPRGVVRQSPRAQTPTPVRAQTDARGEADEDFDLNIAERRITEQNFFASTEVSAGDESARGLALRVGVEVGAESIDVLLRNVRGHVRFRASLDALRRVLDARRAPATETPPSVP
ncbi:MAG: hypothetical protein QOF61_687 [Acidobacteriota bacterium]|nr:hypothetical protein [Acidobacteriota bacterium]